MSRFSILVENGIAPDTRTAAEKQRGKNVLADLQLDRTVAIFCPEAWIREPFLDVLTMPLSDPADVRFRYRVGGMLSGHPQLLETLIHIFRRLAQSKQAWDGDRSHLFAHRRNNPSETTIQLRNQKDQLALTGTYLRVAAGCLREVCDALDAYPDCRAVLMALYQACRAVWQGKEELFSLCDRMRTHFEEAFRYRLDVSLTEELCTEGYVFADFDYAFTAREKANTEKEKKPGLLGKLFARDTEREKDNGRTRTDDGAVVEEGKAIPCGESALQNKILAIGETDRLLTALLRAVYDRFSRMEDELAFYAAIARITGRLADRGVSCVVPEIREPADGTISFVGLYDLLLLAESAKVEFVVPNDLSLDGGTHGLLITGENNSGKTVYLRSIGTAVLFAGCGVPIPAKGAVVSLRGGITTQFAKAEGELVTGNAAGRFEEEVIEVAEMVDSLAPDALVLLNETFQTTAYAEGAAGMEPILRYIASRGGTYLFVTHLTALVEALTGDHAARRAYTTKDPALRYKVIVEE